MQISSTHTGFIASPGPSVALPAVRKPAAEQTVSAHVGVSSAVDARALQKIAPPVAPVNTSVNTANNMDTARMLILARQNEEAGGLSGNNVQKIGRLGNDVLAQRAVMEYSNVAMQEQRFELAGMLVGIDVFA